MRPKAGLLIALTICLWTAAFTSASAATVTLNYTGGNVFISAAEIIRQGETRLILKGAPCFKDTNTAAKTVLEASAETITLTFFAGKSSKAGAMALIKSAEFVGPMNISQVAESTVVDASTGDTTTFTTKTDIRADNANYDGAEKMAHLSGNVAITYDDPSVPYTAVAIGDQATINLDPNPGPSDFRLSISSSPGVSRFEATPRPKGETQD